MTTVHGLLSSFFFSAAVVVASTFATISADNPVAVYDHTD